MVSRESAGWPIRVVAEMSSRLVVTGSGIQLDALLMAAVARRDDLPPLTTARQAIEAPPIDIPIALSDCGRYYLCSSSMFAVSERETRRTLRRFPLAEAIDFGGSSIRTIKTGSGPCKGFMIPSEAVHVRELTWVAVGDPEAIASLLSLVTRLGRRRAVGEGLVRRWRVERVRDEERWPGWPVLSPDGAPLRPLPLDVPGLSPDAPRRFGRTRPPYWLLAGEEEIAAPSVVT